MKDLRKEHLPLFQVDASEASKRVQVALNFLVEDSTRSIHDKVAGDFDYEELIAALLCAREALSEQASQQDGE